MGISDGTTPIFEHTSPAASRQSAASQFRGVTPRDQYGNGIGGDFELFASAQYLFPITPDNMLRGVVFVDTGTVEPTIKQWNENYRVSPGFGLRITVPMLGPAPIALDFAFPVAFQHGSDRLNMFSFFVGWNH